MKKIFLFRRELFKLNCEYKGPQRREKEFEYHISDISSEHSFSGTNDERSSHSIVTKKVEVRSIYYSEYTEEDKTVVRKLVEYSAEEKGVTIEQRIDQITDNRPWWKILRVWMAIAAIGGFIVGLIAMIVAIIVMFHQW